MEHVILFGYILIFSSGFAALAAAVYLVRRLRSRLIVPVLIIQVLFLASLGLVAAYFYLSNMVSIIGGGSTPLDKMFISVSTLLNILLLLTVGLLVRRIHLSQATRRWLRGAVYSTLGAASALMLVKLSVVFLSQNSPLLTSSAYSMAVYLLITVSIGCFGILLVVEPFTGESGTMQRLLTGLGICSVAFVPLSIGEFLLQVYSLALPAPLSLDFLFYLGCSGVLIYSGMYEITNGNTSPFSMLPEHAAAAYSLTPREREMVHLIARGLSNKEISFELSISPATVRTHIYNLYQKVEVQSRIELLNRLYS